MSGQERILDTRCFRTSCKGGPDWRSVLGRVAVDARSGKVIDVEGIDDIRRDREHRYISNGKAFDVQTVLLHSVAGSCRRTTSTGSPTRRCVWNYEAKLLGKPRGIHMMQFPSVHPTPKVNNDFSHHMYAICFVSSTLIGINSL